MKEETEREREREREGGRRREDLRDGREGVCVVEGRRRRMIEGDGIRSERERTGVDS